MNTPTNAPFARRLSLLLAGLSLSASSASGQPAPLVSLGGDDARPPVPPVAQALGAVRPGDEGPYFDRPGGPGTPLWVRGSTYKARFDSAGATYIPFLGSATPRNYPLRFQVASVAVGETELAFDAHAEPLRVGDEVHFDRGPFTEVYSIRRESMEQLFVFHDPSVLPGVDEVSLKVDVTGDYSTSSGDAGLAFTNPYGGVNYTSAVTLGARGGRRASPTRFADGTIEITIPRSALEELAFPLVVDPVISSSSIDSSIESDGSPDVTYVGDGKWLVVWERDFSVSDHDVYSVYLEEDGTVLPGSGYYLDSSAEDWLRPRVAHNRFSGKSLVVVQKEGTSPRIGARFRTFGGPTSLAFEVGSSSSSAKRRPDVGGDPEPVVGPTTFLVVWEDGHSAFLRGQVISSAFGDPLGSPLYLDDDGNSFEPDVSESSSTGASRGWNVTWRQVETPEGVTSDGSPTEGGNADLIRVTRLDPFGAWLMPDITVHNTFAGSTGTPVVSSALDTTSSDPYFLVAWEQTVYNTGRIFGRVMLGSAPVTPVIDITSLLGVQHDVDCSRPSVDSDGSSFFLAYSQDAGGFPLIDRDVYGATLVFTGSELAVAEGPVTLVNTLGIDTLPAVAAARSAGGGRESFFAAWTDGQFDFSGNIGGAHYRTPGIGYSYCSGGVNSVGSQARIRAHGSVSVGQTNLVLEVNDAPPNKPGIFFLGTTQLNTPFGEGLRCVGGQVKRVYPFAITDASGRVARSLDFGANYGPGIVPGGTGVNYQYWYRDPSGGPAGFNLSDAVSVYHTP